VTPKGCGCNDFVRIARTEAECSGAQPVGPVAPGLHPNDGARVVLVANRYRDGARAIGGECRALDPRAAACLCHSCRGVVAAIAQQNEVVGMAIDEPTVGAGCVTVDAFVATRFWASRIGGLGVGTQNHDLGVVR